MKFETKKQFAQRKLDSLIEQGGASATLFCNLDLGGDDAPDTNPGMIAAAESSREVGQMQKDVAMEYLNFSKEQYADFKDDLKEIAQAQKQIMSDTAKRGEEYATYERETFRPLEKRLVAEAEGYSTSAKQEELASQGMADVAQAYQMQRQQALDTMAKYGINPNSARFAAINAQLGQGEAAARAGVATKSVQRKDGCIRIPASKQGRDYECYRARRWYVGWRRIQNAVRSGWRKNKTPRTWRQSIWPRWASRRQDTSHAVRRRVRLTSRHRQSNRR